MSYFSDDDDELAPIFRRFDLPNEQIYEVKRHLQFRSRTRITDMFSEESQRAFAMFREEKSFLSAKTSPQRNVISVKDVHHTNIRPCCDNMKKTEAGAGFEISNSNNVENLMKTKGKYDTNGNQYLPYGQSSLEANSHEDPDMVDKSGSEVSYLQKCEDWFTRSDSLVFSPIPENVFDDHALSGNDVVTANV